MSASRGHYEIETGVWISSDVDHGKRMWLELREHCLACRKRSLERFVGCKDSDDDLAIWLGDRLVRTAPARPSQQRLHGVLPGDDVSGRPLGKSLRSHLLDFVSPDGAGAMGSS